MIRKYLWWRLARPRIKYMRDIQTENLAAMMVAGHPNRAEIRKTYRIWVRLNRLYNGKSPWRPQ